MSSLFAILKHGGQDLGPDAADATGIGFSVPLSPIESYARTHAWLCTVGFLILLPIGTLVARYTRTFTRQWFWAHAAIQLVISGPVIFVGWSMGYNEANKLETPHFTDPHQKMGLVLLIMYVVQILVGLFIHFVKIHTLGAGRRPMQNYFHAVLGLAILALAASQVHYGLQTEWLLLGGLHPVAPACLHAWLAVVVVFWALYFIGLALLPRQFRLEKQGREGKKVESDGINRDHST
ncbi:hypothetical protein C8J56DRAFT_92761 [Mycena floridula]|nr:hypothetical protein C8J56DRAFT_92761 [Mycena floridula]